MPSVEQVAGTLPCVCKEKFPNTFAIIDGSEIFIETLTYKCSHRPRATTSTTILPSFWLHVLLMELFPMSLHFMLTPYWS